MSSPARRNATETLADIILRLGTSDVDSFFARVKQRLEEEGLVLPNVTIDYEQLSVRTEASSATNAIPSLVNVIKGLLKTLTWQKASTEELVILHSLTGQIRPGRLTLLLGPPSCGKSTLLRTLAGRGPSTGISGSVRWNGHTREEFCAPRTAAFVAQVDAHIAALTTRETAAFAHTLQFARHDSEFKPGEALAAKTKRDPSGLGLLPAKGAGEGASGVALASPPTAEQLDALAALMLDGEGRVDLLLHMFGLANCADTCVGSAMVRGISGGERKRLSTVEMLTAQQRVIVMDEISTGLDSATLFNIIRWLRCMTHTLGTTTVISLLQPPPETFAMFDDVMIMADGRIVYHGPVETSVAYFTSLGFQLPPRKDVPSWLQELMTVKGQVMYGSSDLKAAHHISPTVDPFDEDALAELELLVSLDDMVAALPKAAAGAQHASGIANRAPRSMAGLIPRSEPYALGVLPALVQVLRRQSLLFLREASLLRARVMQCAVIGLIVGSLFYQLSVTASDARTFLSSIFLSVMFMSMGSMAQMNVVLQTRSVWIKQRGGNMYNASSYAWAMSLVQVPISVLETLIFSLLIYFLIGFSTDGAQYYFIYAATLFSSSMCMSSLFRMLGCTFRDPATANSVAGFVLLMLIVTSGFIIVHRDIPNWMIEFYWISPFAYALRNLAINEMTAPRWHQPSPIPGVDLGIYTLRQFDIYTHRYWIGIGFAFLWGAYVLFTQLAAVSLYLAGTSAPKAVIHRKSEILKAQREARAARITASEVSKKRISLSGNNAAIDGRLEDGTLGAAIGAAPTSRRTNSGRGLSVARGMTFTPISLVWRHLSYYVPVPKGLTGPAAANIMPADHEHRDLAGKKRLLDDLTGYARPGVLTALMGGSGAGKTTLMDVLAGRKTQGVITGELLVNGHPKVQATWSRVVGYVEQTDVHSGGLTVAESLHFSAALRLTADVAPEQRAAYVGEVLQVTELLAIQGNIVGTPGLSGLSVEQRRRLSIGVELVANPSIMFMDEPTSGLDARSAVAVMAAVKNVAGNGRTVMVTIHQPSIEIFEEFDALVLVAKGGVPIFFGPLGVHSEGLVNYFEAIPGVPKLPPDYNPATWMLEVCGGGAKMYVESVDADFHALYTQSDVSRRNAETADVYAAEDKRCNEPLKLDSQYAIGRMAQLYYLVWKHTLVYWRNPPYSLTRLLNALLTGLVFGATFWKQGKLPPGEVVTLASVQSILGSVYSGISFMGMTNLISGIPAFSVQRTVSYRERASSMYAVAPLAVATGVVEIPYLLVQGLLYVPLAYFMAGFKTTADAIFIYYIIFVQAISIYTFLGQMFVYLMPNPVLAQVLGSLVHLLWQVFNGFLIPRRLMPRAWRWFNYLCATTWVVEGLGAAQLGDVHAKMLVPGYPGCSASNLEACPTVSRFVEDYWGYKYGFRWSCVAILFGFMAFFRVTAMIVLKLVNHQRR